MGRQIAAVHCRDRPFPILLCMVPNSLADGLQVSGSEFRDEFTRIGGLRNPSHRRQRNTQIACPPHRKNILRCENRPCSKSAARNETLPALVQSVMIVRATSSGWVVNGCIGRHIDVPTYNMQHFTPRRAAPLPVDCHERGSITVVPALRSKERSPAILPS